MDIERRAKHIDGDRNWLDRVKLVLTKRQWQVVERYYWQGQTMQEIGDALGIRKPTVHEHIQSAKKRIKPLTKP